MKIKNSAVTLIWLVCAGAGGLLSVLTGTHLYLSPTLPSVESLRDVRLQTPLRIYSYDGELIGEIGEKRRTPVKHQNIPQQYIDALLSAEDARFYYHNGVSIRGLLRASSQLLMSGGIQGGGSTITMQVARNYFLSFRQEFRRKFNEILLALRIERELTKDEILELYVNVIFLGNRAYGIEAAAQVYYGKTLSELNLPQLAMIAGLPKAPSTMNPLANPERALQRRNWILGRMYELGKIDKLALDEALSAPITATYHNNSVNLDASYVAEMARQVTVDRYGSAAYTDGYVVYTTVLNSLQRQAQKSVAEGLLEYDERHGYRGPEQILPPPIIVAKWLEENHKLSDHKPSDSDTQEGSTESPEEEPNKPSEDFDNWYTSIIETLQDTPIFAQLLPAGVIEIHEKELVALLEDGKRITIPWENGLESARPYISVNARGPKPDKVSDILELGAIIRTKQDESGGWHLGQIPAAQAALVSLNPDNGAVQSLVGGLDFRQSNFNRATQAKRQPGSNFKPIIYTAALENGFTAASIVNDAPIMMNDAQLEGVWRPENSSGKFYGEIRLRQALYRSINLASVRLLRELGISKALENIDRFGLDPKQMPHDLTLVLGSHAMTPMEVASAYAIFANGGYKIEPYFIDRILNVEGEVVYRANPLTVCDPCNTPSQEPNGEAVPHWEPSPFEFIGDPFGLSRETKFLTGTISPRDFPAAPRVIDERVAFIMDSILKDVVMRGTATKAKQLQRSDLAGKTGTTNGSTDAWFSGYGGGIVTTAWIGFDQYETLGAREFGSTGALPIWMKYMEFALKGRPEKSRTTPHGIVTVRIDPKTGKRAQVGQDSVFEYFREEYVPELEEQPIDIKSPWQDSGSDITQDLF